MSNKNKFNPFYKFKKVFDTGGITRRWLLNSFLFVVALVYTLGLVLSFTLKRYYYDSITQGLYQRAGETARFFSSVSGDSSDIYSSAISFLEGTDDLEKFELQFIDRDGSIVVTSTGFSPPVKPVMNDYLIALDDPEGYGMWRGKNEGNEEILAVTRLLPLSSGYSDRAIRFVVSLEAANRQMFMMNSIIFLFALIIILVVLMSGTYFIKTIVNPVHHIGLSAKKIAHGDFSVKLMKEYDDEIGDLCGTINDMASELALSEKMKNDFISSVSHELRTPLTAIKGWGETLLDVKGADEALMSRGINVIISETERLSGLVEDLLDFSRIQDGRLTMKMQKTDLLAELEEAVLLFKEKAFHEGKTLIYSEPDSLPLVWADANRLKQVFVNIIDNAVKYTASDGTIIISASEDDSFVVVTVTDSGCGIPSADLPRVKERFFKSNHTQRGFGIGLAVANEIVTMHSGSLDIKSEENIGTTVTVMLPVIPVRNDFSGTADKERTSLNE